MYDLNEAHANGHWPNGTDLYKFICKIGLDLSSIDSFDYIWNEKALSIKVNDPLIFKNLLKISPIEYEKDGYTYPVAVNANDARKKRVKIKFVPMECDIEIIKEHLMQYGHVFAINRDTWRTEELKDPLFQGINKETLTAIMDINKDIPSFIKIMGSQFKIEYLGQPVTCPVCNSISHNYNSCPARKARRWESAPRQGTEAIDLANLGTEETKEIVSNYPSTSAVENLENLVPINKSKKNKEPETMDKPGKRLKAEKTLTLSETKDKTTIEHTNRFEALQEEIVNIEEGEQTDEEEDKNDRKAELKNKRNRISRNRNIINYKKNNSKTSLTANLTEGKHKNNEKSDTIDASITIDVKDTSATVAETNAADTSTTSAAMDAADAYTTIATTNAANNNTTATATDAINANVTAAENETNGEALTTPQASLAHPTMKTIQDTTTAEKGKEPLHYTINNKTDNSNNDNNKNSDKNTSLEETIKLIIENRKKNNNPKKN